MVSGLMGVIIPAIVVLILATLTLNSFISAKNSTGRVGVMRALGANTVNVGAMQIPRAVPVCFLVCVIGIIGTAIGTSLANEVVNEYVAEAYPALPEGVITFAEYSHLRMVIDCLVTIALSALGGCIPVLAVRNVKPIKIIKAKE